MVSSFPGSVREAHSQLIPGGKPGNEARKVA